MSLAAPTSTKPSRRWLAPRFSLRALLIVMTLLCLVFAPVLPELNRADRVARQVKIIEEMGGQCVFADRPRSFFARLVQRFWPMKVAHIEHDLLMAEFGEQTVDLAKLRQTPDIRGVCFNECLFVLPDDEPDVRLPRIEYVQLQERDDVKGGKPDPAILGRFPAFFPNLRKAQLMGVPQVQEFIDELAQCSQLEDLDLWFRTNLQWRVNSSPLSGLVNLRRLRMSGTYDYWDWAFLERLSQLEEVELGTASDPVGCRAQSSTRPAAAGGKEFDPSRPLSQLKTLRHCDLHEFSALPPSAAHLASNNELESFRIPPSWSTLGTLATLREEFNLRALKGVVANTEPEQPRDAIRRPVENDARQVFQSLRRFPRLRELEIHFPNLTDECLHQLSELKSLERIVLSFDPHQGAITSEGIELFRKLPIAELNSQYSSGLPLAEGMQRLVDSWPGPHPGMPFRQSDEGLRFLQENARR